MSHVGDEVTLDMSRARVLLAGEHYHVLKSIVLDVAGLRHVNGEGWTAPTWSETDTSAPLQLFDVRVANACEDVSPAEYPIYPPGYDILR